nr:site-specific integrase [Deinococcus misasensis]
MKILQLLRRAFAEAVSLEVISKNPAANIRAPRAPRAEGKTGIAWTREEVQKFLEVAREYRLYPLYCLAFSIGARIGEIQALKIDDLNLQDGTLNIQRSVSGRDDKTYPLQISGGKTEAARRKVRLPEDVKPILAAWLFRLEEDRKAAGPQWNEEGWLFPSMNGKLLRYIPFWQNFQIVLKRSGIRTGTIHDMRRTFITLAIRSGVLPEVVAKIVGHSSVRITLEEYRRVQDDELENAAVTLTGLLG